MNLNFVDALTYISGIASVLGIMLQFKDSFPEHRETRKAVFMLVLGIFVGSIIGGLRGVKVDFGVAITSSQIVLWVLVFVTAGIAIVGAFVKDQTRRGELFIMSAVGIVATFILLAFGGMSGIEDSRIERQRKQLTVEEILELSTNATARGNYERALTFIEDAKSRLLLNDERLKILDDRIRDIKNQQVSGK
ncbi:hypothetical protein [Collimonas humicola]|uniref:hypothetical protein n=1 Tax=Collimonas humicola TaxID=2825886 RepID=UPI001B8B782F|nr:hypothetical protein [Collimonas humicola]